MAVPRCPKASAIGRITRGGRPVTRTNRAPAASTRANAATVRSEIVPSPWMIVPSRSVATRDGDTGLFISCKTSRWSADAAGPELDAVAGSCRAGRLGHGVLPGALAAAAHHEQVPVPEHVAQRFP